MSKSRRTESPPSNTLLNYFSPATQASATTTGIRQQSSSIGVDRTNHKKRRRSQLNDELFNNTDDEHERKEQNWNNKNGGSRRSSLPASFPQQDDYQHEYVVVRSDGVVELPTPERLGLTYDSDESHQQPGRPRKKQRNARRSAPPEVKRSSSPNGRIANTTSSSSSSSWFSEAKQIVQPSVQASASVSKKRKSVAVVEHLSQDSTTSLSPLVQSMNETASSVFGIQQLNPFQCEAIQAVFHQQDSLIVVPTGAGKSLCYQLPSLMKEANDRFVIVVSPLISLMEDQVRSLREKKIDAIATCAGKAKAKVWDEIRDSKYRLIYSSPEYMEIHRSLFTAIQNKILLIAIDEVHCISEWGHSFRPAYRKIVQIREWFPGIPCMCLTATATTEVQKDIIDSLRLPPQPQTLHLRSSINRSNIFYRVCRKTSDPHRDFGMMFDLPHPSLSTPYAIQARREKPIDNSSINPYSSTIIYVSTKVDADGLARALTEYGLPCAAYHAGHPLSQRTQVHNEFMEDRIQVICATIAFGMGIDKPDIRRIIHWCLPSSIEGYSQQSGRAGRDRQDSEAVIMWSRQDVMTTESVMLSGDEKRMSERYRQRLFDLFGCVQRYVDEERKECLRVFLIKYFGEEVQQSDGREAKVRGVCRYERVGGRQIVKCDYCSRCTISGLSSNEHQSGLSSAPKIEIDLAQEARILLNCIIACGQKTGYIMPCKVAIGSTEKDLVSRRLDKHNIYGQGKSKPLAWWKEFFKALKERDPPLVDEKALAGGPTWGNSNKRQQYLAVYVTKEGREFLRSDRTKPLIFTNLPQKVLEGLKTRVPSPPQEEEIPEPVFISAKDYEEKAIVQLKRMLVDLRLQEARAKSCAPFDVLRSGDIDKLIRIRPSSLATLLKYIPLPGSCSRVFLQKVVNEITTFAAKFGLGIDQVVHASTAATSSAPLDIRVEKVIDFNGEVSAFGAAAVSSEEGASSHRRSTSSVESINGFAFSSSGTPEFGSLRQQPSRFDHTHANSSNACDHTTEQGYSDLSFEIDDSFDIDPRQSASASATRSSNASGSSILSSSGQQPRSSMNRSFGLQSNPFASSSQSELDNGWKSRKPKIVQNESASDVYDELLDAFNNKNRNSVI